MCFFEFGDQVPAVGDVDTTMDAPQRKQSNIVIEIPVRKKSQIEDDDEDL